MPFGQAYDAFAQQRMLSQFLQQLQQLQQQGVIPQQPPPQGIMPGVDIKPQQGMQYMTGQQPEGVPQAPGRQLPFGPPNQAGNWSPQPPPQQGSGQPPSGAPPQQGPPPQNPQQPQFQAMSGPGGGGPDSRDFPGGNQPPPATQPPPNQQPPQATQPPPGGGGLGSQSNSGGMSMSDAFNWYPAMQQQWPGMYQRVMNGEQLNLADFPAINNFVNQQPPTMRALFEQYPQLAEQWPGIHQRLQSGEFLQISDFPHIEQTAQGLTNPNPGPNDPGPGTTNPDPEDPPPTGWSERGLAGNASNEQNGFIIGILNSLVEQGNDPNGPYVQSWINAWNQGDAQFYDAMVNQIGPMLGTNDAGINDLFNQLNTDLQGRLGGGDTNTNGNQQGSTQIRDNLSDWEFSQYERAWRTWDRDGRQGLAPRWQTFMGTDPNSSTPDDGGGTPPGDGNPTDPTKQDDEPPVFQEPMKGYMGGKQSNLKGGQGASVYNPGPGPSLPDHPPGGPMLPGGGNPGPGDGKRDDLAFLPPDPSTTGPGSTRTGEQAAPKVAGYAGGNNNQNKPGGKFKKKYPQIGSVGLGG